MKCLALFDFDGTITTKETFSPFLHYAVPFYRRVFIGSMLGTFIAAYKAGLLRPSYLRKCLVMGAFFGADETSLNEKGLIFSRIYLSKYVRPLALERIRWHKRRGDTVVLVSASLSTYLSDWAQNIGIDLVCSKLESSKGVLTGLYQDGDCTGPTKAQRIRDRYNLDSFQSVYAYGDTAEDFDLLSLADKRDFRWKEVTELSSNELLDFMSYNRRLQKIYWPQPHHQKAFLEELVCKQKPAS